jgi:curved DNA-binding protein CbpA
MTNNATDHSTTNTPPPPPPPFPQLQRQDQTEECLYAILNVSRDATVAQIQRHFKLLSRSFHPDKAAVLTTTITTATRNDSTATEINELFLDDNHALQLRILQQQQQQAASTFVRIKTAADVLSDPVYRAAYNHGGALAVMLIKRSQSQRHASSSTTNTTHTDDNETNDEDYDNESAETARNLYAMLEQTLHDDEQTADLIHDLVHTYRLEQEQKSLASASTLSPLEVSCAVPYVLTDGGVAVVGDWLQRDSAALSVRSQTALSNALSVTWSTTSQLQRTAQTALTSSVGVDWQTPSTRGATRIRAEVAAPHSQNQRPAQLSVQSTRQTATGTVLVAMLGGTWNQWSSWNATFLSSKVLQWEPLWWRPQPPRRPTAPSQGDQHDHDTPTKVMGTWRISCSPVTGQLRHFMASVKRLAYPQWACRLAVGPYPFKLSWQSAETNAWRVSYSWGWFVSRIKVVRRASLTEDSTVSSNPWTITYGLKYDGQAQLLSGAAQPPWSILLHVHSDYLSLRLPIGVELTSTAPVAWMASFLCAELVDQQLQTVSSRWMSQWMTNGKESSGWDKRRKYPPVRTPTQTSAGCWSNVIATVAAKKHARESSLENGLIIRRATWRTGQRIDHDMTDTLQFWIVDSRLHPTSMKESRLWWGVDQFPEPAVESKDNGRSWWDFLFRRSRSNESEQVATRANEDYSLTIRYQLGGTIYEVYLAGSDMIQLPHPNATELGPADRVS